MMKINSSRPILIGAISLAIVYTVTNRVVKHYLPPGSMTVIEAQAMDMKAMSDNTPKGSVPVAAEEVSLRVFTPIVTYTGTVVAFNDSEVYPRVTGTLTAITVYPGDRVRKGQVVARLDSAELDSKATEAAEGVVVMQHDVMIAHEDQRIAETQKRSLQAKTQAMRSGQRDAQAQLSVSDAFREQSEREMEAVQLSLADSSANVTAMQADADYWKSEIVREEQLLQAKAVTREEYDRERAQTKAAESKLIQAKAAVLEKRAMIAAAKAKVRQSEANSVSARAKLEQARAGVQGALADIAAAVINTETNTHRIQHHGALASQAAAQKRTADIIRSYTEIRAAQDGVVTERLVSPGTLVQPGMAILKIKNADKVRLQANVSEADLSGVRIGSSVLVMKPSDPSFHLHTSLTAIFNSANAATRTVTVEALTPNMAGKLLPGEYIIMDIATAAPRQVITIPQESIQVDVDQKPFVWTLTETSNSPDKTIYSCLMHPQIIRDAPGKCPICSMILVPKIKSGKYTSHRVFVTLGATNGKRTVVESGLVEKQQVITRGQENLNEDDSVSSVEWDAIGPTSLPQPSGEIPSMPGMNMGSTNTVKMPGMNMGDTGQSKMPGMDKVDNRQQKMPGMKMGGQAQPLKKPDRKSQIDNMEGMPGMDGK